QPCLDACPNGLHGNGSIRHDSPYRVPNYPEKSAHILLCMQCQLSAYHHARAEAQRCPTSVRSQTQRHIFHRGFSFIRVVIMIVIPLAYSYVKVKMTHRSEVRSLDVQSYTAG